MAVWAKSLQLTDTFSLWAVYKQLSYILFVLFFLPFLVAACLAVITAIKAKWDSLRAQHRRELAKENKTESGQSADDLYESSWQYMEKMRFVEQVKKTAQSTSTLKLSESSRSAEISDTEIDLQGNSLNSSKPLVKNLVKENDLIQTNKRTS